MTVPLYFDRVQETTTTTGTGDVTLSGAKTGYRSFGAVLTNGQTLYYVIADQGGPNWEVGLGTYNSSPNTITRTTVRASSNAGSLVNFGAGSKDVFLDMPAKGEIVIAPSVRTSGSPTNLQVTGPADTTLAALTEAVGVNFDLSATRQFATGAITTQREVLIQAPTYGFVGASTITDAVTVTITGPPIAGTNATLTNAYPLRLFGTLVVNSTDGNTAHNVKISHDGTNGIVTNTTGEMRIESNSSDVVIKGTTHSGWDVSGGSSQVRTNNLTTIGWCSTNDADGAGSDTGFERLAAQVIGVDNGTRGGAAGWLQNTAGRARVTGNVTNATATMSNLTDLSLTLIAGRKYFGRVVFIAKDSTGADGLQFDFNGGTATMTNFQATAEETPIGATLGVTNSTALGTALTSTVVATTDTVYAINLTMVVNAGGTFIPRFAQVSHSTGTATVELGSSLFLEDSPN